MLAQHCLRCLQFPVSLRQLGTWSNNTQRIKISCKVTTWLVGTYDGLHRQVIVDIFPVRLRSFYSWRNHPNLRLKHYFRRTTSATHTRTFRLSALFSRRPLLAYSPWRMGLLRKIFVPGLQRASETHRKRRRAISLLTASTDSGSLAHLV